MAECSSVNKVDICEYVDDDLQGDPDAGVVVGKGRYYVDNDYVPPKHQKTFFNHVPSTIRLPPRELSNKSPHYRKLYNLTNGVTELTKKYKGTADLLIPDEKDWLKLKEYETVIERIKSRLDQLSQERFSQEIYQSNEKLYIWLLELARREKKGNSYFEQVLCCYLDYVSAPLFDREKQIASPCPLELGWRTLPTIHSVEYRLAQPSPQDTSTALQSDAKPTKVTKRCSVGINQEDERIRRIKRAKRRLDVFHEEFSGAEIKLNFAFKEFKDAGAEQSDDQGVMNFDQYITNVEVAVDELQDALLAERRKLDKKLDQKLADARHRLDGLSAYKPVSADKTKSQKKRRVNIKAEKLSLIEGITTKKPL